MWVAAMALLTSLAAKNLAALGALERIELLDRLIAAVADDYFRHTFFNVPAIRVLGHRSAPLIEEGVLPPERS
jgi:hypothetical protein